MSKNWPPGLAKYGTIESGHKMFDAEANKDVISVGNVWGNAQFSNYIRPWSVDLDSRVSLNHPTMTWQEEQEARGE